MSHRMEAMRKAITALCVIIPTAAASSEAPTDPTIPVTVENFARAESDNYLATNAEDSGLGKLLHRREPASIEHQTIIRLNRDTLYSFGVFDLKASPVTITLPDARKRFMSMQVINEDHYVPLVAYDHQPHTITEGVAGTRYIMIAIRTLANPNDRDDLEAAHKLQDAITIRQEDKGTLELPNWDQASLKEIREALLILARHTTSFQHAFGAKGLVDPIKHLIGTATGWGGNPDRDATYVGGSVQRNDGKTVYKLRVKDVPVDGFWSISVYNAAGYFEPNPYKAYSLNNITAKKDLDGAVTVQFGGCNGQIPNCLPTTSGWNYLVRLYRPHSEILDGKWKVPQLQPVAGAGSDG
jgi:hypothetical protein